MSTERSHASMICPYCGHYQPQRHQCAACNGLLDPLSQKATQIDMGPWFIRDAKQPYRPGCSYEILQRLARSGRIDSGTILRGPTTYQYWTVARLVPGVSHLVGFCYRCSTSVQPTDTRCSKCQAVFMAIPVLAQRNELGLRFPTAESAAQAREQVAKERPPLPPLTPLPPLPSDTEKTSSPSTDNATGIHLPSLAADLLRGIVDPPAAENAPVPSLADNPSDSPAIAAAIASGLQKLPSPPCPLAPAAYPNPTSSVAPAAWPNPTASLPRTTGSSQWTIILIVLLNLLLLAIVVAVIMMLKG